MFIGGEIMKKTIKLQKKIEDARQKLYILEQRYNDFQHPLVLKQSMLLDELINEYINLKNR